MCKFSVARSYVFVQQAALLVLILHASAGCSFLFVSPPPEGYQAMPYFDCTTNVAAPIIDTLLAVGDAVAAGVNGSQGVDDLIVTGNVLGAVLFGVAAGYGYVETGSCSKAKAEWAYRQTLSREASGVHAGGCERDTDCKGERVCEQGMCVAPGFPPAASPPAPGAKPKTLPQTDTDDGVRVPFVAPPPPM